MVSSWIIYVTGLNKGDSIEFTHTNYTSGKTTTMSFFQGSFYQTVIDTNWDYKLSPTGEAYTDDMILVDKVGDYPSYPQDIPWRLWDCRAPRYASLTMKLLPQYTLQSYTATSGGYFGYPGPIKTDSNTSIDISSVAAMSTMAFGNKTYLSGYGGSPIFRINIK